MPSYNVMETDGSGENPETSPPDVTDELMEELLKYTSPAERGRKAAIIMMTLGLTDIKEYYLSITPGFIDLVDHNHTWDIKVPDMWRQHFAHTPFPGKEGKVIFRDIELTPECLGNLTYGYIGASYGYPYDVLLAGSYYAANYPTGKDELSNELMDWRYISIGYYLYITDTLQLVSPE